MTPPKPGHFIVLCASFGRRSKKGPYCGNCHSNVSGRCHSESEARRHLMSLQDFLRLAVAAALIVLAAAVHSPFAESLSPVLTSAGAY
jgi:hypothetical protein